MMWPRRVNRSRMLDGLLAELPAVMVTGPRAGGKTTTAARHPRPRAAHVRTRADPMLCASRPRLYHLREEHGRHEVDLLAELRAGKLVAFEVKAGAADLRAVRHLTWLRERLGERFARGVVLHTGPRAYELDDRIIALPICALWG
jgi:predicted AAA+ superfamily ATPase